MSHSTSVTRPRWAAPARRIALGAVAVFWLFIALYLNPANHARNRFGWWNVYLMGRAERAEVTRLGGHDEKPPYYLVKKAVVTPSPDWTRRMRSALLNTHNYDWDAVKMCLPQPGIMVRLYTGSRFVDTYICFECEMVWTDGHGDASIDPLSLELAKLVKELFPNDPEIQAIKLAAR